MKPSPERVNRLQKQRVIVDCERDVKGIHQWKHIGVRLLWCHECGALGSFKHENWRDRGFSGVTVIRRVQESP